MVVWYQPLTCLPWQDKDGPPYGYRPSLGAGVAFCVLFGLSAIAHSYVAIRARKWWQFVFAVGAIGTSFKSYTVLFQPLISDTGEAIGWGGRTWSSHCPYMTTPYMMQISTLILGSSMSVLLILIIN